MCVCVFVCKHSFWLLSAAYVPMWLTLGKELLLEELFSQSRKAMAWGIGGVWACRKATCFVSDRILTVDFHGIVLLLLNQYFWIKKSSTVRFFDQFIIHVQHLDCITATVSNNSLTISIYLSRSLWAASLIILNAKFKHEFELSLDGLLSILGRFSIWSKCIGKRFPYWKTN